MDLREVEPTDLKAFRVGDRGGGDKRREISQEGSRHLAWTLCERVAFSGTSIQKDTKTRCTVSSKHFRRLCHLLLSTALFVSPPSTCQSLYSVLHVY